MVPDRAFDIEIPLNVFIHEAQHLKLGLMKAADTHG